MSLEAMKQALELVVKSKRYAEECSHMATQNDCDHFDAVAENLRKAIQEEALRNVQRLGQEIEQEPYGWVSQHTTKGMYEWQFNKRESSVYIDTAISIVPVYTHPPQRTWVGLTIDEILDMLKMKNDGTHPNRYDVVKEAEAKLKEKNHG